MDQIRAVPLEALTSLRSNLDPAAHAGRHEQPATAPAAPHRSPVLEALANNVHRHRTARGWSFATLARNAGTSVSLMKHIEKRRSDPSVSILFRIANALGVRVSELVGEVCGRASIGGAGRPAARYGDPEAIASALGARARSHRIRRNWDRKLFAKVAGISTGTIHYLETNTSGPTTTVVERVAAAFGLSFSDFVEPASSPVLSLVRSDLDSESAREASDLPRTLFAQPTPAGELRITDCCLERRGSSTSFEPLPPGSTSVVCVMRGTIRVCFEAEEHILRRGDLVVFAAESPATMSNEAAAPASFLRIDRELHPRVRRARG
jgi:transcriptional regulator with XRE-family HTH domain